MDNDRSWMYSERKGRLYSQIWANGVEKFIEHASSIRKDVLLDLTSRCPCNSCGCSHKRKRDEMTMHLLQNGFKRGYEQWTFHGEVEGQPEAVEDVEHFDGEADRMDDKLLDSIAAQGKIRDGVGPGQIGAWHHQHRMQQGTNTALCSKKAANIWTRYDIAMTEKSGENWQEEHPYIDHVVVHNIAGAPHGTFAMGDGVIGPSDALSIKSRKIMHEESYASGAASGASGNRTMLHQVESKPAWHAGIERALAEKTNLDTDALMRPESEPNVEWCDGVERVLQSTSTSVLGASRATVGTRASRSDGPIDDDQISARFFLVHSMLTCLAMN
ncbi:hypothetical protein EJB05_21454, partial [Eragrostis curvula]